jgi:hypothetical protein
MSLKSIATLLVALAFAGASQAQYYSVTGGGGQAQIGGGLPLPIQAATTMGTGMGPPIGTGTLFPPLLIPVNKDAGKALVKQTAGADPKKMTVPPGVFNRPPPGPFKLGVALNNPKVFQVQTNLSFLGPAPTAGSMTFKAGGRTGAAMTTFMGVPAKSKAIYTKTAAQFGGPSQTRVIVATPIKVWANLGAMLPCKAPAFKGPDASCFAPLLAAFPGKLAAAGAMAGFITMTPGGPPPMTPNIVSVSVPKVTGAIAMSTPKAGSFMLTNMATSAGFPWTTGMLTLSQPTALGTPEVWTITGMDSRMGGVGTISLVSGALSTRAVSGPNANRSWARYTLPEPGAVLGAAAALAVLGICHGLVRRRSR